jgi:tRNA1Val (adenine37-N6)-methyltransferase
LETAGFLLGGRVAHRQMATGHRTGIEPVLLAASVPARSGDRVLEAGTGSGAALLCLAFRVPGIIGVGVERDPELAALAGRNMGANGFDLLSAVAGDIVRFSPAASFDHAMVNPPWHDAAGTPSTDAAHEGARRAEPGLIERWVTALAGCLRPRGSLSVVTTAGALSATFAAFERGGLGSVSVFPLWPKTEVAAKLVLLRAVKTGRGPSRLLPGLVLHEPDGRFTPAAEAILREGAALRL